VAKKKTTTKKASPKKKSPARSKKKTAKKTAAKKTTTRKSAGQSKPSKTAASKKSKATKKKAPAKKAAAAQPKKPKRSSAPKARATTTRKKKSAPSGATKSTKAAAAPAKRKRRPKVEPVEAQATTHLPPEELEPALKPEEMEEFRVLLMQERAQLVGDVDTLQTEARKGVGQGETGELSSMPIHMADLGTDNYELEFTLGLIEGGRAKLQEIDDALRRIQDGTYGVCLATGKPITKGRLRAKPWAKYCYEYELAQETGQRIR
jgi:RNA polymerase-binding transcription factor DksA